MQTKTIKAVITAVILVILAAFSFLLVSRWASTPETYQKQTRTLEELKGKALGMTTAATALATAAATIPGDATTPIANKLVDVAGYMVIVYTVIVLEKYLLTLTGLAVFKVLIPMGCILLAVSGFLKEKKSIFFGIGMKCVVMAFLMWALVPASVCITNVINDTYRADVEMQAETQAPAVTEENTQKETGTQKEEASLSEKVGGWFSSVQESVKEAGESVDKQIENFKQALNNMIEKVAVMIVTTCAIPLCVLFAFMLIFKLVTGINVSPRLPKTSRMIEKKESVE